MWAVIKKSLIQFELSVTNLNAINLSTVKTKLADDTVKKIYTKSWLGEKARAALGTRTLSVLRLAFRWDAVPLSFPRPLHIPIEPPVPVWRYNSALNTRWINKVIRDRIGVHALAVQSVITLLKRTKRKEKTTTTKHTSGKWIRWTKADSNPSLIRDLSHCNVMVKKPGQ